MRPGTLLPLLALSLTLPLIGCSEGSTAPGSSGSGHVWFGSVDDDDPDLWAWKRSDSVFTRSGLLYGIDSSFGMTAVYRNGGRYDTAWLTCRGTPSTGSYFAIDNDGLLHGRCAAQVHAGSASWISEEGTLSLKTVDGTSYSPRLSGSWQATMGCQSGCGGASDRSFSLSFTKVIASAD